MSGQAPFRPESCPFNGIVILRLIHGSLVPHWSQHLYWKAFHWNADRCTISCIDALHTRSAVSLSSPFPQIDIIGAMVIVWMVRGKIIRSVLSNIVCNDCAQCNAHTYEQTNSSLDWVLSHWAHFTVLRFIMVALCNRADHYILPCDFYLLLSFFSFLA